ncbi:MULTISPECIES: DUF4349 domain-containing protein [Streptomyces]|uniref:DUF4349 domain-containing protein n=1 Tax=Streptomyces TaxID=1883 RepID=UPI00292EA53A|nr:DUF4349 domain-containing protein [Streptomyces sp. NEAU-HV9]
MRTRRSVRPARALTGILLAATLALAGCSGTDSSGGATSDAKAAAGGAPQRGASDSYSGDGSKGSQAKAPDLTANRIIRTASLTVQVKDVPKALDEARGTTENAGGYIGNESTTRDARGHERTRVVLRVPVEKYDEVLTDLQGTGKLIDRTSKAQDVTDQVVDVDSRIRSQRASVARVRALMDKATKLADVVTLEGELSSREADLEALLARQASLKDRTSLATITLSLSETPVKKAAKDDSPGFTDAVSGGWHVFVTMLRWVALALGAVLPFAALVALPALVWLQVRRRRLPLRAAPAAGASAPEPAGGREPGEES